jgi:polyhydroxyalkanoate synthesis repressor PhaR
MFNLRFFEKSLDRVVFFAFFMQCVKTDSRETMKRIIRRYSNRKMYDPQARRSITLSGIASLLRRGVQVQVLDHPTGTDITSLTLSKVLLEQEKKREASPWGSFLFQELIRQRGSALLELAEKSLSASLEVLGTAEGRLREMVRVLVNSRKIEHREGQKLLEKGLQRLAESKVDLQSQWEKVLRRMMPEVDTPLESEIVDLSENLGGPDQIDSASLGWGRKKSRRQKAGR